MKYALQVGLLALLAASVFLPAMIEGGRRIGRRAALIAFARRWCLTSPGCPWQLHATTSPAKRRAARGEWMSATEPAACERSGDETAVAR